MNKLLFRPQDLPKKFIMQERLLGGGRVNYNFRDRVKWYPVGWGLNKRVIGDQFARLHYLACHAPKPIQQKYKQAYLNFYKKHFGGEKISMKYANTYTCHSWL